VENGQGFTFGDRVRVVADWFVAEMREAVGTVAAPPVGMPDRRSEGIYWVEFDEWLVSDAPAHPTEAAEVDGNYLVPAGQEPGPSRTSN
jgi:hypothetical protein